MITVRQARAADAPAVAELVGIVHAQHVGALPAVFQPVNPVGECEVRELIAQSGPLFVVAEHDGRVVGYARAEVQEEPASPIKRPRRTLYLQQMGVVPALRRAGIGRALLRAVRAMAREQEVAGITLDVYAFNAEARAFYAREGFLPFRERLEAPLVAGAGGAGAGGAGEA